MTDPLIAGFRGEVRDVRALVTRAPGMTFVRADRVYGRDHLLHAARLAQRAVDEARARTTTVATETMLYAAGERQIGKALATMGLAPGVREFGVVVFEGDLDAIVAAEGWTRDDSVLEGGEPALDALGISHEERALLPRDRWGDLVLERVALTDVLKA